MWRLYSSGFNADADTAAQAALHTSRGRTVDQDVWDCIICTILRVRNRVSGPPGARTSQRTGTARCVPLATRQALWSYGWLSALAEERRRNSASTTGSTSSSDPIALHRFSMRGKARCSVILTALPTRHRDRRTNPTPGIAGELPDRIINHGPWP